MKKIFKSRIFIFILGAILFGGIGVVSASILYQANEIGFTPKNKNWKVNNLESALNDLYENKESSATKFCTFVESEYGDSSNHLSVGSKYSCDPGDGTPRNFYILEVRDNSVDLIMEENIATGTMSWYSAINYFDTNSNGKAIKTAWDNVIDIDLPQAQDIANAGGITGWNVSTATIGSYFFGGNISSRNNYLWLWDYTRICSLNGCNNSLPDNSNYAYGYWTKNLIHDNSSYAWNVGRDGCLDSPSISNDSALGVRPVITVLKDNLQG